MKEAKAALIKQLKKLEEATTGTDIEIAHAICEITKVLVEVERAEIALGKREFGSK